LSIPEEAVFKPIKKIVYATDLSCNEEYGITKVIGFAKLFDTAAILLHIHDDEIDEDQQ
jgi:hypothetical protein